MALLPALTRFALHALVIGTFLAVAAPASAHMMGVSRGEYVPDGRAVRAELVFRADDVALAVPGLDADGDGRVSAAELERGHDAIVVAFFDALTVRADGALCRHRSVELSLDPPDGIRMRGLYECARSPSRVGLRFGFLEHMAHSHRHLATVRSGVGEIDALAMLSRPEVQVDVCPAGGLEGAVCRSQGFASLLRGGIEHILSGPDHLAFLLALVLGATATASGRGKTTGGEAPLKVRVGPLVAMLTAFTVGHSISLGAATLSGFAPPSRWVEPVVALSVAYVGAENLLGRGVDRRWLVTFPFGLVHGFAFAGALLPLGLARAELPAAVFAFNLGVEAGQLMVLAVLLPPLAWLRRTRFCASTARAISAGIVLAGMGWFFARVFAS